MTDDIIYNKIAIIERCLYRINEEYNNDSANLKNITKQDSIVLNIQRACEASIDLAMHFVAVKRLGIPQNSRDAFDMLAANSIINKELADRLKAMVGFRNIAAHNYQDLDLSIIEQIIKNNLKDLLQLNKVILI
ncbi:MAG: type VII toxin-antitoxin system HepT family RNase toxin [Desulfitobacteriia bacterium]|jgi:uncharacterized protein YutE (UPF0331/DUF86 family)